MSETQILASTQINPENIKMDEIENRIAENTKAEPNVEIDDEDLEDGEIDDDDDDEDISVAKIVSDHSGNVQQSQQNNTNSTLNKSKVANDDVISIDLLDDKGQPLSPSGKTKKSKKPKPVEDDHASSIENALANILKKKGIEPVSSVLDIKHEQHDQQETQSGVSRSSRRRKRKKQREEKDKQKGSSEKKKGRYESPEGSKPKSHELEDDELIEDYEMLNVRGGSPPPMSHLPNEVMTAFKEQYDSAENSSYSYESYESENEPNSPNETRRKRRNKKDKDQRKRKDRRNRNDAERQDKRNRRAESSERQEPRKMELCKFYLMECCAKRDKCSYMHGDFPCKYYYLGMDCALGDECKFAHGQPLTEQLRNILLKHLETAPKDILGNFKRISREQAIVQMTKRHEELCKKFNVQNIWPNYLNLSSNHNRRNASNNDHQQNQQQYHNSNSQQHQHQQQLQQQQQQQQQHNMHSNIPSLLDLDIRPPTGDLMDLGKNSGNSNVSTHDKQRKSRWCDNAKKDSGNLKKRPNLDPPTIEAPSYLDLKNLTGILSEEHIKQLSDLGIVNLEQVNQLTVGQLNQIGLTIGEINEIQLNAKNMANLGVPVGGNTKVPMEKDIEGNEKNSEKTDKSSPTNSNAEKMNEEITAPIVKSLRDETTNSNSNSSSGVIMVDYSQYLKDSHLPFDRGDDDERDDEQLIIDDGNAENEESPMSTPLKSGNNDLKKLRDSFSDNEHQSPLATMHGLAIPDFTNALRNPFKSIPAVSPSSRHLSDPRSSSHQQNELDVFKLSHSELGSSHGKFKGNDSDSDSESYYASRGRRSRSVTPTRSGGSSTPEGSRSPLTDDFGLASKPRINPKYERNTMYDFDVKRAGEEDADYAAKSKKTDKDMRFMEGTGVGSGDIDLRLPFLPVTNYTPATEIDGSITSHLPMTYKVYEVDISPPNYVELRQNFKSDQTSDPRLRRILGLPETATTRTAVALSRTVRKLSTTIASPESSDGASPKYYTPSMSSNTTEERIRRNSHSRLTEPTPTPPATASAPARSAPTQLRLDPRRAARQAAESASTAQKSPPVQTTAPNNANKQNVEIRNYLQKSEWYKNLNSKFKIMVNQQLALVSTELKKFHQDPSPTKIFDISFIVNNSTLQQILTNLGIYIDDNGEVAHIDGDADDTEQASQGSNNKTGAINTNNIVLPNLSQPPPTQPQQLDFLRAPPPNMFGQNINMQQFSTPPPNTRPSLLGLPPGAPGGIPQNPFNPFSGNVVVPFVGGPNGPQLLGPNAPSLLGPGPGTVQSLNGPMGFGNFGMPPNMQQKRNFGIVGNNNKQRNQRQRRNNFNGSVGSK